MKIAGIDYSMTSPALCIGTPGDQSQYCQFYGFASTKKSVGLYRNVNLLEYPSWGSPQERFDKISEFFLETMLAHGVERAWMEGYAFGGNGKVFDLAENTGLLKHKLWKAGIPFEQIAPGAIKKYATGKGNQQKDVMYEAWLRDGGHDLNKFYSPKATKIGSPTNDIVDQYFTMSCGVALNQL